VREGFAVSEFDRAINGLRVISHDEAAAYDQRDKRAAIGEQTKDFRAALPFGQFAHFRRGLWRAEVKHERLIAFAEGYEPSRGNVLIVGKSGVGKTTVVAAAAHRLLGEAFAALDTSAPILNATWLSAPAFARARRETRLGAQNHLLEQAIAASLLILDELGGESSHDAGWLNEIADERYKARRPTLTTSGFDLAALSARYGAGCTRRLVEPVGVVLDVFEAPGGK